MDDGTQVIAIVCRGTPQHMQRIVVEGYDYEGACDLAKILDGSDQVFIHSPRSDPNSMLAHCTVCKALIDATVLVGVEQT